MQRSAWSGQLVHSPRHRRIFNERRGAPSEVAHGAVTTGNVWRFLRLKGDVAEVEMNELYIHQIDRILGVLLAMTAA